MGQKVNATSFRIGKIRGWDSNWIASKDTFAEKLQEDQTIRDFFYKKIPQELLAKVLINRTLKIITATLQTPRAPLVLGPNGKNIAAYTKELKKICQKDIQIQVVQLKKPELNAQIIANTIAVKLGSRTTSYQRVVRQAISTTMRMGAEGVMIKVGGRLNGAEIARSETRKEGRMPLQTGRADIDYAVATAKTTYGAIGIKVWVFLCEVYGKRDLSLNIETPIFKRNPDKR